jgi:uncharacterized membrane protein
VHTVTEYEFGSVPGAVGFVYETVIAPAVVAEGDAVTAVGAFTELGGASPVDAGEGNDAR